MADPFPLVELPGHPGVIVLSLEPNQGPMVVLDLALIQRIEASLRSVPRDATGLILASRSPRVFIAGADLKQIESLDVPALDQYLAFGQRVFGMLPQLTIPTVAALNGAALGGGLELAMHCDGLVAAPPPPRDGQPGRPYPIGLPEAGLSICPGWGGTNLLPARIDPADAIRRTATGRTLTLDEAAAAGLVQTLAPSPDTLLPTAASWLAANRTAPGQRRDGKPLHWIGRPNVAARVTSAYLDVRDELGSQGHSAAAAAVLKAVGAGLENGWEAALAVERTELNRLRHADAGRAAIRAFFEKSAAPRS
ncbi:MAG: enoyl-CoA hydratase/isomerase family protein [Phycisphaerales bacterium]